MPVGLDDGDENKRRRDAILSRVSGAPSDGVDDPPAAGVSFTGAKGDVALNDPHMALLGEPLDAMVQNLGQSDNSYVSLGGSNSQVLSQGFTTGSDAFGYRLQGIGVNIEGSDDSNGNAQVPSGPTSVSVAVHADSNGKPGAKLFDLVSPGEFAAGHSFFEAPPGTNLAPNTSYVLVWRYNRGTWHRLQKTSSNSEDSGALTDTSIANAFRLGGDVSQPVRGLGRQLVGDRGVHRGLHEGALRARRYPGAPELVPHTGRRLSGVPVQGALRHTSRGRLPTSGDIEDYNTWVQLEAARNVVRVKDGIQKQPYKYTDPIIQDVANNVLGQEFKAVVCTAAVDAPTNTGMTGAGVPVHWLDGGWEDRPRWSPTRTPSSTATSGMATPTMAPMSPGTPPPISRPCHGLDRVRRLWSRASGVPHG